MWIIIIHLPVFDIYLKFYSTHAEAQLQRAINCLERHIVRIGLSVEKIEEDLDNNEHVLSLLPLTQRRRLVYSTSSSLAMSIQRNSSDEDELGGRDCEY